MVGPRTTATRNILERELARRVEGTEWNGGVPGKRADVDDLARTRGPHPGKRRVHHAHGTEEVRFELRLGLVHTRLFRGARDRVARVVAEHVEPAGLRHDLLATGPARPL